MTKINPTVTERAGADPLGIGLKNFKIEGRSGRKRPKPPDACGNARFLPDVSFEFVRNQRALRLPKRP